MKKIIDLHQDLLMYISHPEIYKNTDQTSFEKIKSNNVKVVIASAFPVAPNEDFTDPTVNNLIEKDLVDYNQYCKANPEFVIIKNKKDLNLVLNTNELYGLILHIEGLNCFEEQEGWRMLEKWYNLGLRSIGPLWNINNPFGGGTLDPSLGLTTLGQQLIKWCEKKGVIFDFAHMNEKTFWDATKIVTRPIFVSHGNSYTICPNVRNYKDEQLSKIRETGGVIGVFFSKKFLSKKDTPTISDVLENINHIVKIGGEEIIAIGSDFGGILSGFAQGLSSLDHLQSLIAKIPESISEKIAFKNASRIINSHLL